MSNLTEAPIVARPSAALHVMGDVAAQREIAQVQAAIFMARRFPRDPIAARDRVVMACARAELAEVALYTYARGGTDITGPSIRMAEAIAQNWGNLEFGVRELEQRPGESTVETFAIDLETNTRQVKVFQVPHVRYTREGGRKALEDPRDVYEQVANQAARRLRACILGIVPGDVIDAAVQQVEATLKIRADVTPERIKAMLEVFAGFGVSREQIEKRIQRRLDALTPALLVGLGKIANSLKDGMSGALDWFDPVDTDDPPTNSGTRTEQLKDKLKRGAAPASSPNDASASAPSGTEKGPAPKKSEAVSGVPAGAGQDMNAAQGSESAAPAGAAPRDAAVVAIDPAASEDPHGMWEDDIVMGNEPERSAATLSGAATVPAAGSSFIVDRLVDAALAAGAVDQKNGRTIVTARMAQELGIKAGTFTTKELLATGKGAAIAEYLEGSA